MFLKGECADFPDSWSDRMWGPDDLPNQRTQYELRRAAVRICEACPVRAECLAFGIMVRDQYGIYGGLPLRARRQVLKTAQEAGFRFEPRERGGGTRTRMQTPQDRSAQRAPATMARHHTLDRQGEGPGRHTHPALAGHPLLKTIRYR